ncbi:type 1 glutamine amidotransferase [Arthrobacter sp. FW306-2-2C-D06B]|uniref:type 1 glutamine amidotransferase n=1 Tax=Arthrobacter sp. FW306-2-2C-D06B TaxID=2879618 RepID=UPI001F1C32C4|nr:type 1 glutamine amidotransferase [Arthrobacter sp. FW306-2-2C-D06B]UKA60517.1 type 1 glutamine amidotransferase [Arthrobacter sp. FW306-2-2C-D06B]
MSNQQPRADSGKTILGLVHKEGASPGYFANVVNDHGYEFEIANFTVGDLPDRPLETYAALIVFGGSPQVDEEDIHPWLVDEKSYMRQALALDLPLMGVCLGAQLLAEITGGKVGPAAVRRRGWGDVGVDDEACDDPIFSRLPKTFRTLVWHAYEFGCPPDATPLGRSTTALQAFRMNDKRAWGVQFHPEVDPAEMDEWLGLLRESGPAAASEAELKRWASEASLYADDQQELSRVICGGFIKTAVEGGSAR